MAAPSSTAVSPAPGGRRKRSALGPGAPGQGLGTPVKEAKDKGTGLDLGIDKEHHHPVGGVRRLLLLLLLIIIIIIIIIIITT